MKTILTIVFILTYSTGFASFGDIENAVFLKCYDGDTCTFDLPGLHPPIGKKIGVRLDRIDTPEIRGKCEVEKRAARAAKRFLNQGLKKAGKIKLINVKRGNYFRIVATIIADGVDMNALIVKHGLGVKYDGGKKRHSFGCGKKP